MVSEMEMSNLRLQLFGEPDNGAAVARLEETVERKLSELRNLTKQLAEAKRSTVGNVSAKEASEILSEECPYLIFPNVERGDRMTASADAMFFIGVKNAPFHVFTESGKALHSTLPVNNLTLKVASRRLTVLKLYNYGWEAARRHIEDTEPFMDKVALDGLYGHPHCDGWMEDGASGSLSADRICMGDESRKEMLEEMNSVGSLLTVTKALYSWLVDLNADSMYHTNVAPATVQNWYIPQLQKMCEAARPKVLEFVNSADYVTFINRVRSGFVSMMPDMLHGAFGMLGSIPELKDSLVSAQADLLSKGRTGGIGHDANLALGMHQLLADVLVLGARDLPWYSRVLQRSAHAGMALLGGAWVEAANRYMPIDRDGSASQKELMRYVADWEVTRDGSY